jgi:hypothetical protein
MSAKLLAFFLDIDFRFLDELLFIAERSHDGGYGVVQRVARRAVKPCTDTAI